MSISYKINSAAFFLRNVSFDCIESSGILPFPYCREANVAIYCHEANVAKQALPVFRTVDPGCVKVGSGFQV